MNNLHLETRTAHAVDNGYLQFVQRGNTQLCLWSTQPNVANVSDQTRAGGRNIQMLILQFQKWQTTTSIIKWIAVGCRSISVVDDRRRWMTNRPV